MNWMLLIYGAVSTGVLIGIGAGVNLMIKKAAESKYAKQAAQLGDLIKSLVAHADAEFRPVANNVLADGKITPEEGKIIKAKVLELAKSSTSTSLKGIAKILGFDVGAVDVVYSGLIERAVEAKK